MIVTVTPNPSLDRTIELTAPLGRGEVQRASGAHQEPGGKGVNISRVLFASGVDTLALLPGDYDDAVLVALRALGIPHRGLPLGSPLRSNITITEPDGTTTKLNEPGPVMAKAQQRALLQLVTENSKDASWLVLAGSLPPGLPADFYTQLTVGVRSAFGAAAPRIAIDSSGAPLAAALAGPAGSLPDVVKPNAEELAELTGFPDPYLLETDPLLAAKAAQTLVDAGVGAVLATLGSKGAVLVTNEGSWLARSPKIVARSTVGAGDSALAGYLLSQAAGATGPQSLQQAVAHGAAAAALPGSTVPALSQTNPAAVSVTALSRCQGELT
ncbi:1-phosphofructokinase family hexose kinase [Arthrobacter sp. H14-L1]|uniref:1-phosphofructokinase family hexose kinase n=1 Tax=Arthrobacter sp. H14-L1 TaxID=2996697 RepID=UPI0022714ED3|nr:hexose kinase [Arthrobacter sp. H14-L1]MCY0904127.1 hexose kinase [Arthrobacter sp. H14-L1]